MANLYVSSDYNSTTEGWGTTHFSSYSSAIAKSTATDTIIMVKNTSVSGNCMGKEVYNYKELVIQDGAVLGNANSKWDMVKPITIKAGGVLQSARGVSSSYGYTHVKSTLTIGEAGAEERAKVKFVNGPGVGYQTCCLSVLYNGNLVANNADIEVGDLGTIGASSFTDCVVTVVGSVSFGAGTQLGGSHQLKDSTVNVVGHDLRNENTYFSNDYNRISKLTMDNSTIIVDDGVDDTVADEVQLGASNKALTMKNGSLIQVEKGTSVVVMHTVTMEDSTLDIGTLTVNSGKTLTMDAGSTIKFVDIINNGTITITAEAGTHKVLDYTGTGTKDKAYYQTVLGSSWNDNFFVMDSDLYLTDQSNDVIYVNSAWTADNADGKVYGYNAFSKFDTSGVDADKGWSNLMVLPSNTDTVVLTAGNTVSYGMLRPTQDLLVKTVGEGYAVIDRFVNVLGNLTFDKDAKVKVLTANGLSGANNQGDFKVTVNGEVYVANATSSNKPIYLWGLSSTPGQLLINAGGKFITEAGDLENRGSITVYGYMELGAAGNAPKLSGVGAGNDTGAGHLLVDGKDGEGKLVINHNRVNFGGGNNSNPWEDAAEGCTVTVQNGGVISSKAVYFRNGKNNTLTLNNGTLEFVATDYSWDLAAENLRYFDNQGAIVMSNGAKLSMAGRTFTNAGTITLDYASTITAGWINNANGSITIDADGFNDRFVKVIDVAGNGLLAGTLTVNNLAEGVKVIYGADGDVALTNQNTATLYVNSAWAGKAFGDDADGKVYGYNAFSSLAEIGKIKLADGADTVVKFESDVDAGSVEFNYGAGDITFTADKAVTIKQNANSTDWVFVVGDVQPVITIGKNVTFQISDNNSGLYVYYGAGLKVEGTITGGENWGCTYLAFGNHSVEATGTVSTGRVHLAWTTLTVNGDAASDRTAAHIDTNYLLVEDSTFNANNAIIDAAAIHDTNNGGMRYGASTFNFNNSKLTAGSLTIKYADSVVNFKDSEAAISGAVNNAGTIKVTDSTITANYYGTGTMYLDDAVVNGTLNTAWRDEALNGSKVVAHTGSLVVTGDVTLNGVINNSVQVDQGGGEPDGISNNPGDAGEFYSPYHNKGISGKILMGSADKVANVTLNGSIITGGNTSLLAGSMLVTSGSGIYGMTENEGAWMNINTNGHFDFAVGDMNVYGTADNFDVAFDGENPIAEVTLADGAEMSRLGYIWIGSDQHDKGTGAYVLNISAGAEVTSFYNLTLRGDGVVNVAGKIESFTAKAYQSGPQEHASDGGYVNNNGVMNVSSTGFVKVNGMNVGRKPALGVAELNIDGGTFEFGRYGMNVGYSSRDGKIVMTNGATLKSVDHNITLQYNDGASAGINNNLETAAGKLMIGTAGVGSIKVSDSTVDVSSVVVDAANGAFEVTGKSKLVIDSLTGVIDADDAELTGSVTGSVTGGTLNVTGNSKVTMASAGSKIVFGSAEKSVDADVDVTGWTQADFTAQNGTVDITGQMADGAFGLAPMLIGGFYNNNNADVRGEAAMGSTVVNVTADAKVSAHQVYIADNEAVNEHTLNVYGELAANASIFNKAMGNLNICGKVSTNYLQGAGDVTVSGANAVLTLAGVGGNGAAKIGTDVEGLRSQFTIADGATVTAGGAFAVGYNNGSRQGDLVLTSGKLDVASLSIDAGSTFSVNAVNGLVLVGGELSGTGTITIDAAEFTGSKLLVDMDSCTFAGEINLINASEGLSIIRGEDGDIVLTDVTQGTIYVNTAWAGMVYGDIVDGKVIGVNAFGALEDITDDLSQGIRKVIYTAAEASVVTIFGEAYTAYQFNGKNSYVLAGREAEVEVEAGVDTIFDFTNAKGDYKLSASAASVQGKDEYVYISDWNENTAEGEVVGDGMIFGENAFASFETIDDSFTTGKHTFCYIAQEKGTLVLTLKADAYVAYSVAGKNAYVLSDAPESVEIELGAGETFEIEITFAKGNYEFSASFTDAAVLPSDAVSTDDVIEDANSVDLSAGNSFSNWVGAGDNVDWFEITNFEAKRTSFTLSVEDGDSRVSAALYSLSSDGTLRQVRSWSTVSSASATLALSDSAQYFIKVTGSDSSYYTMQIA